MRACTAPALGRPEIEYASPAHAPAIDRTHVAAHPASTSRAQTPTLPPATSTAQHAPDDGTENAIHSSPGEAFSTEQALSPPAAHAPHRLTCPRHSPPHPCNPNHLATYSVTVATVTATATTQDSPTSTIHTRAYAQVASAHSIPISRARARAFTLALGASAGRGEAGDRPIDRSINRPDERRSRRVRRRSSAKRRQSRAGCPARYRKLHFSHSV